MRVLFVDDATEGDAMSSPPTDLRRSEEYSEWHHFTLCDDTNGLYGIFNLAMSGNVHDASKARAGVSLAIYERNRGWHGTMNLHPFERTRATPGCVDLVIGENMVRYENGRYEVSGSLKDGSAALSATWTPRTTPLRVDRLGGVVNTFILPSLRVDGTLDLRGRRYELRNITGYHDHNWGVWGWGGDLSWNWGYVIQAPWRRRGEDAPLSLVFGRVISGRNGSTSSDAALGVWLGKRCAQIFLGETVEISTSGVLEGVNVPRTPGVMAFLAPGQPSDIPRHMALKAHEAGDSVEVEFDVEAAMQFLIPHPSDPGHTTITELVGQYNIRTVLDGETRNFTYHGFAEVAR